MTKIKVNMANLHDKVSQKTAKMVEVNANCAGGETGIFAVFQYEGTTCLAAGDDGQWHLLTSFHRSWLPKVIKVLSEATTEPETIEQKLFDFLHACKVRSIEYTQQKRSVNGYRVDFHGIHVYLDDSKTHEIFKYYIVIEDVVFNLYRSDNDKKIFTGTNSSKLLDYIEVELYAIKRRKELNITE